MKIEAVTKGTREEGGEMDNRSKRILELLERIDQDGGICTEAEKRVLEEIEELNLSHTQISSLPKSIGECKNLKILNLSFTQISSLPERIVECKNLKILYLGFTQISSLPKRIGKCKNLGYLSLIGTQISSLPERIGECKNLSSLYLNGTQISSLPERIGECKNLIYLELSDTKISSLPESIGECKNLSSLDLSDTQINDIPESLANCTNLKYVYLNNLSLQEIPEFLLQFQVPFYLDYKHGRRNGIYLNGTKSATQDMDIFRQPREMIEAYFKSLRQTPEEEWTELREAKFIFLGNAGAGKTHTITRLMQDGEQIDTNLPPTPGVKIETLEKDGVKIRMWDFGGQEIMHSMHRCFLTNRTCYVVVLTNRTETDQDLTSLTENARYWLRNIESYAPGSKVILAVNQYKGITKGTELDMNKLVKEFPNNQLSGYIVYNAADDSREEFLAKFGRVIEEQAKEVESYRQRFSPQWMAVRKEIEESKEYYIPKEEYYRICKDHGLIQQDSETLPHLMLSWFNDLGICFSFHQDREKQELADYHLLNPRWLTNGIYLIINGLKEECKYGKVSHARIFKFLEDVKNTDYAVWHEVDGYKDYEVQYILDIMRKFHISDELEPGETEFIPSMCQEHTPKVTEPEGWVAHTRFELEYDKFLQDTVIHQLKIYCVKNLQMEKSWARGLWVEDKFHGLVAVIRKREMTWLQIDVYACQREYPTYLLLKGIRDALKEINVKLNQTAHEYAYVESGEAYAYVSVNTLLDCYDENRAVLETTSKNIVNERTPLISVDVAQCLTEIFGRELVQARHISRRDMETRSSWEKEDYGAWLQRELIPCLQEIAKNTRQSAGHAKVISGEAVRSRVTLEEIREDGKEQIRLQKQLLAEIQLAKEIIASLEQSNDALLQEIAQEMKNSQKTGKSGLEVLSDRLGDGANIATIVTAIAPFLKKLLDFLPFGK